MLVETVYDALALVDLESGDAVGDGDTLGDGDGVGDRVLLTLGVMEALTAGHTRMFPLPSCANVQRGVDAGHHSATHCHPFISPPEQYILLPLLVAQAAWVDIGDNTDSATEHCEFPGMPQ